MLTRKTILDQIECTRGGTIQIRLKKLIVDDEAEGEELASVYHRTVLEPGASLDAQVELVNAHLEATGYPVIPRDVVERIRRIAAVEHTPAVVAAYQDLVSEK